MRSEYVLVPTVFTTRMVYLAVLTLLPFVLLDRGVAPESLGLLVGIYGYAAILMDLMAGALSDRFSPKRLAVLGSLGVALAVGLLNVPGMVLLLAGARLLHGISMGLFRPAITALVLSRVDTERRAYAVGINNVAYVAGAFVGPLLAGVLADTLGVRVALGAFALVVLLSAAYLAWSIPDPPRVRASTPIWKSITGLPALIRRRQLGVPLVLLMTDITILHLWLVYLPLYLSINQGFTLTAAGILISIEALSYALAQPAWGRLLDRLGYRLPVLVSLLAHGLCIALVPLAQGQWLVIAALLAICGALNAGVYPGCVALAAASIETGERGRAMGLVAASSDLGQVLGPLLANGILLWSGDLETVFAPALVIACLGVTSALIADTRSSVRG